jgi:hypothetical protein
MLAGIDHLIENLQQQSQILRATQLPHVRQEQEGTEDISKPVHTLDEVHLFIGRLSQIQKWLMEDPHLLQIVDRHLSQHVKAMEKHQRTHELWFAIATTLAGAILGWLVSALASPVALWHLLFR